jgi:hypothetical protein
MQRIEKQRQLPVSMLVSAKKIEVLELEYWKLSPYFYFDLS